MLKLIRYVKPYWGMVVIAIVLLFVQANANLALPDYMARIVNNGIQQGGVEDAVAEALRPETMQHVLLFLTPEEQQMVRDAYRLVTPDDSDYADLKAQYPALDGPVYVLQPVDTATRQALNPVMAKGLVAAAGVAKMLADPEQAAALAEQMGFDLGRLPAGANALDMLPKMPEAIRAQVVTAVNQRFAALGDTMLEQMAVSVVKAEYEALGADIGARQMRYILRVGLLMLGMTLVSILAAIGVGYFAARTAAGVARDLREAVFAKVVNFSAAEFNRFSTASLITRTTNDVTQIQRTLFLIIRLMFFAPILGIGGILHALDTAPNMWWILALALGVLTVIVGGIIAVTLPKFRIMQRLVDRLNLVLRENLTGLLVVRAFNRQPEETARFDRANRDLTRVSLFVNRVMVLLFPLMMLLMNALAVLILWVGAHQVDQGLIQVGDMMAFLQYAFQVVMAFMMMTMMFVFLPRSFVSGDRIAEVLETEPTVKDPEHPKAFPEPFRGVVAFDHVCFRYPGAEEDVLHDISFVAEPGKVTAIIGTTGSGKSTLVNLIPRFYDVTEGAIRIDGVDIREVRLADLRRRIGYVPQRGALFTGTIADNLRMADEDAPEEVLHRAVEVAQAAEFVFGKPEGLAQEIAQGGANVSGGQKQRLAIARALVRRAPIYIFDDSFSALDFKTEAALRRALQRYAADATVIIVTQRVAPIRHADQILVLDKGRLVGKGTHEELLRTNEVYREIALTQLGEEVLA